MFILKMKKLGLSVWFNSYQGQVIFKWQNLDRNWSLSDFRGHVHILCDSSHGLLTNSYTWVLPFLLAFLDHIYHYTFSPCGCKNSIKNI